MTKSVPLSGASFPRHALIDFINTGCAYFPYSGPPLAELAVPVFEAFREFLAQDESRLSRFRVCVDREGNIEPDDGYIRPGLRSDGTIDPSKDRKRYFHYRKDLCTLLPKNLRLNSLEEHFLLITSKLFAQSQRIEYEFASALERELPEFPFVRGVRSPFSRRLHVLRLLAYDPSDGKRVLAKSHYDRDFATLHIHETDAGLFHGEDGDEVAHIARPNEIFLFAGDKAQVFTGGVPNAELYAQTDKKVIDGGVIKPRRHVVRPSDVGVTRYSAVYFGHIGTVERRSLLPWK